MLHDLHFDPVLNRFHIYCTVDALATPFNLLCDLLYLRRCELLGFHHSDICLADCSNDFRTVKNILFSASFYDFQSRLLLLSNRLFFPIKIPCAD